VASKYSVWLIPDRNSEAYRQLDDYISEYADEYEDAPEFEPHVTVLGGIKGDPNDITPKTRTLAAKYDPIDLQLTRVQCSTTTHQCVFALVEPTVHLLQLHDETAKSFDENPGMYVPHVSLLYSDMSIEDRVSIAESTTAEAFPETATATTLAVVETDGPVAAWDSVDEYQL
jgi:2'-5' RNA ligase